MIDIRPVAYVIGRILIVLAIVMLLPAIADARNGSDNWRAFIQSGVTTGIIGVLVVLTTRNRLRGALGVKQAYLLTVGIWTLVPLFGGLPFWIGAPRLPFEDAYFEAVSGITTTGATMITGLDRLPTGLLIWRGMLNWLGGLGIAFIAMIFLPVMRVGGMQFFRTEGFDTFGKELPRADDIARQLAGVYIGLTVFCILAYQFIGMTPLDAVVNGLTTISTGGFSSSDLSFAKYPGAGEYAGTIFMLLGSLPYIRYVQLVNGSARPLWQDEQVRAYLRWLLTAVVIVTLWRVSVSDQGLEPAFRESLFNLTSIMSSTGYGSGTFASWGAFVLIVAYVLGTVGACSGSSAAGLSVFRVQLAMAALRQQIGQIISPNSVTLVKYEHRRVGMDVLDAIIMFITGYILLLGTMTVALTLFGVDTVSAMFGVWTTLGNVGYGFGPLVARTGTFIDYPAGAVAVMTLAMILGRLGLLAIMVVVLPSFWRR